MGKRESDATPKVNVTLVPLTTDPPAPSMIDAVICVDWPAKTVLGVADKLMKAGSLPMGSDSDVNSTLTRDDTPAALAVTEATPAVLPELNWVCAVPSELMVADARDNVPRFVEKVMAVPAATGSLFAVVTFALIIEDSPSISILVGVAVI